MANMKYRDVDYDFRPLTDLRDLMNGSVELYGSKAAYLVKDRPGGYYRPITYRAFRRDVTALGTALLDMGLGGKKVAVVGENSYHWIVSYMATVCGTGVVVPIDKELSADEIGHLLRRAEVGCVISSGKMEHLMDEAIGKAGGAGIRISMDGEAHSEKAYSLKLLIEKGLTLIKSGRKEYFEAKIDPGAMCSLIFTSGTTGLAKGVMLSHANIAANVVAMSKGLNVVGWTALSVLPMHHTYSLTCDVMATMYQGCTVAICEGLKYIMKNLEESKANFMLGVPLMFEKLYQRIWKQAETKGKSGMLRKAVALSKTIKGQRLGVTKKVFKDVHEALGGHMRMFIAGGAAIDPKVVEDINAMGILMIQGYGMTENAPIIAVNRDRCHKAAAAGPPMRGTEVKILDPDPDGIGEILCKGPSVMLGYYEDPEGTAEVLKDGWLYTGDYGHFDEDGFLYITGRKKNVIVTKNGKNIFPEEVEYYLLQSPYIEEVMVWGKEETRTGDTVICAEIYPDYIYINGIHEDGSEAAIREILDEEIDTANALMPSYKRVKRFILRREEFEKTTTKKIKRHKVPHDEI